MIRFFLILVFLISGSQFSAAKAEDKKVSKKEKIEKLDTEVIEASPLDAPMSTRMRKKRQQMEMETEERFVQKLENARMEDERRRQESLFNPQPVEKNIEFAPAAAQASTVATTVDAEADTDTDKNVYVSLAGGTLSYPVVGNLPSVNGAGGVGLGIGLGKDFWIEGGFLYSFQQADIQSLSGDRTEDIDHFGFSVAGKYTFGLANHWVNPMIGLSLNYTRREFNGGDNSSNAFDGGLLGGVDFAMNSAVKIGVEGRYMFNFDYGREQGVNPNEILAQQVATGRDIKNIEENDYLVFLLNAKVLF